MLDRWRYSYILSAALLASLRKAFPSVRRELKVEPVLTRRTGKAVASADDDNLRGLERCLIGGGRPAIGTQGGKSRHQQGRALLERAARQA